MATLTAARRKQISRQMSKYWARRRALKLNVQAQTCGLDAHILKLENQLVLLRQARTIVNGIEEVA